MNIKIDTELIQWFLDSHAEYLLDQYKIKEFEVVPPYIKLVYSYKNGLFKMAVPVDIEIDSQLNNIFINIHVRIPLLAQPISKYAAGIIVKELKGMGMTASNNGGAITWEIPELEGKALKIRPREDGFLVTLRS